MADEQTFTAETVLKYLLSNGGKVSNHELVKHFKKFLSGSDSQNAKTLFKEYVNSVATMKMEDGVKYVIAKKRVHGDKSDSASYDGLSLSSQTDAKKCKLSEDSPEPHAGILHSHSSPSILGMVPNPNSLDSPITPGSQPQNVFWSSDLPPGHVPQPPPRRKHSLKGKENRGAKFEESIRQINEEREVTSPKNEEIRDIVSPGSVKEKAHFLNKMASEQDPSQKSSASSRRRDQEKGGEDDDTCSVSTLDPRRKEWIITSSQSNYHELVRLLREEPKLVHVKDHNKYTALHWAAKHGNLDVIKLIAGTHRMDTNVKTSGGYTPLHLAAMFGREEIMEVLINTYGADPSLRDYSGKRPLHYLPKNQVERFLGVFPMLSFPILICGKVISGKKEKEHALMRMGSLNSKVKRTSVLSAGRALTRMKSWGSADNIPDRAVNLMPPPKTYPKKKKSRKHGDIIGLSENWRAKSVDSDSDSTSGAAA